VIEAVVDDDERPALEAAAAQLRDGLAVAAGEPWQVAVRFVRSLDDVTVPGGTDDGDAELARGVGNN